MFRHSQFPEELEIAGAALHLIRPTDCHSQRTVSEHPNARSHPVPELIR
jgi:hypothetical protein